MNKTEKDEILSLIDEKISTHIDEEILKYLNVKDLFSFLSNDWEKTVKNNELWYYICRKNGWNDCNTFSGIKSSFVNKNFQFNLEFFKKDSESDEEDNSLVSINTSCSSDESDSSSSTFNYNFSEVKLVLNKINLIVRNDKEAINEKSNNDSVDHVDDYDKKYTEVALNNICDWKMHCLQRKFLLYNWHKGRYQRYCISARNRFTLIPPNVSLTFAVDHLNESWSFLPAIKVYEKQYELLLLSLNGKPCCFTHTPLERTSETIDVVCVGTDVIAYNLGNDLVFRRYNSLKSSFVVKDLKKIPRKLLKISKFKYEYFIKMNSKYIIAGEESNFIRVWDKKTFEEIDTIVCSELMAQSFMTDIFLHSDSIFFCVTSYEYLTEIYEYNLLLKSFEPIELSHSLEHLEQKKNSHFLSYCKKIIVNENFLIVIASSAPALYVVVFRRNKYGVFKKPVDPILSFSNNLFEIGKPFPQVILYNSIIFYFKGHTIKIINLDPKPNTFDEKELSLPKDLGIDFSSRIIVHENLLILHTRTIIQLWNWEVGRFLYDMPFLDPGNAVLFYDCTRLGVFEDKVINFISFW